MKNVKLLIFFPALIFLASCKTTTDNNANMSPNMWQDESAMKAVAESISGKQLSDKELKKLGEDIKKDPEARDAVKIITDTVQGKRPVAKYSPVTGKRYAPNLEYDPETGAKLLPVE